MPIAMRLNFPIGERAALALPVLMAFVLAGCAASFGTDSANTASIEQPQTSSKTAQPTQAQSKPTKIALLLPFAGFGEPAQIARGMKQAAEMALFDANDPSIQLIVKDDGGTAEGAKRAAETAVVEGADIILGPLFGKAVIGAGPIAQKAGIPVLAFSNDPAVAGRGVYLMSFLAAEEVDRVITFAVSKGKKRFAALIPANPYGQMIEPAFRKAMKNSGGEIVAFETYKPDASGVLASAKRIFAAIKDAGDAGQPVDALFVPAGQDDIAQLGPLIGYSGLDTQKIKLIGTSAWDVPVIARDDRLIGGWYAATDPAGWTTFSEKFQKTFGQVPPRLATLAYDAVSIAIANSRNPGPQRFAPENLTQAQGFSGVDGSIRLKPDGRSERGLAVLEIEKYRSVVIDQAPIFSASPERVSSVSEAAAPR